MLIKANVQAQNIQSNSIRYAEWMEYFFDPEKKYPDTRGNATKSAIKAYNYDPLRQYNTAAVQGARNVKRLPALIFSHLELNGMSSGNMIEILFEKAVKGSYTDYKDFLQEIGLLPKDGSNIEIAQQFNFNIAEAFERMSKERGLLG